MKSGIEMMLNSMGIETDVIKVLLDPNNIKQLLSKVETMCNTVSENKARLIRIENKLETLPHEEVMKLLSDGKELAEQETAEYVRNNSDGSGNNGNDANGR